MVESRCGILCSECSYREPNNCPGCVNAGRIFWGECSVKKCCEAKKLSHCGKCADFPCEVIKEYSYDKEHGDNPPGARIEMCRKWMEEECSELDNINNGKSIL